MPIAPFLTNVEALLKQGNATEHSYRPALKMLFEQALNATATNEPKQAAYGAPDFLIEQSNVPIGHVEAKDIDIDLTKSIADSERDIPRTANGKQLRRYRSALPNLLYTDGLEWHWFVEGVARLTQPVRIATWESSTKKLTPSPTAETDLANLLKQFAAHTVELIGTPTDLAHRLANIARWLDEVINTILTSEDEHGSLHHQLEAFRQTLLPNLTAAEFADMYAQTIVYGLFAARIVGPNRPIPSRASFSRFDAAQAIPKTNPFLRKMFQQIAGYDLDTRITWLVDDCARLLERTDMSEVLRDFGKATMQQDPVVHFYEDFLAAYDPKTREMRGVYYTPEPVVSYIVRSVDELLQTRFGKSMGLADGDTIILDPATGTATFLHAVVQHIHSTLQSMGMEDTWNQYVPDKLLPRLFGFELLMAPYTVAHLKLGMLLHQLGYSFGSDERLGIYLTNALIELPEEQKVLPFLNFIVEEGVQARDVKQAKPVMVVLGNPPYSNYGMLNKGNWIHGLLKEYKRGLKEKKINLDDDFIKFMRFGQWRIDHTGQGILAFITNNTYIDGITHRRMRESLMETFTDIYILDLHGNSIKKEIAPSGIPDENVFAIRQGVAIGIFVKEPKKTGPAKVYHAEMWGTCTHKYDQLLATDRATTPWIELHPTAPFFFFVPKDFQLEDEYNQGISVENIFPVHQNAIKTDRDSLFSDIDKSSLYARMQQFYTTGNLDLGFQATYNVTDSSSYNLLARRMRTQFEQEAINQWLYRPFDWRWIYYKVGVTSRPAWDVMQHVLGKENICMIVTRQTKFEFAVLCTTVLADKSSANSLDINTILPLYLYPNGNEHPDLFDFHNGRRPNISAAFVRDVEQRLGLSFIPDGVGDLTTTVGPEDIFHYIYAVFHSPTYRLRYAEFLRIDFPRVPITNDKDLFATLAAYGAELVDLHLLRLPGMGGVGGAGGAGILLKPAEHGVTQRKATANPIDTVAYDAQRQRVVLGNDAYFAGVDADTWEMQIGGYQPLHKWLKDRKGRTLSFDEVLHYMRMVIALRETRRVMGEIDTVMRF